jgi:hypothetical protein
MEQATLSPTIQALHEAWEVAAKMAADFDGTVLPPVTITVQRSSKAWGHITTRPAWVAGEVERLEVMVSGENLARGPRGVLGTVLHEAAHAYNRVHGIRDTDTNGRHNKRFAKTAEQVFGLTIGQNRNGWSETSMTDEVAASHAATMATLDAAFTTVARTGTALGGAAVALPPARNKNLHKAQCECGSTLRASATVLARGVTCDECDTRFTMVS